MNTQTKYNRSYIERRKKEFLSLVAVRFLKAYHDFSGIWVEFEKYESAENRTTCPRLYKRLENLTDKLFYDVKEKSDFLFRITENDIDHFTNIKKKYDDLERVFVLDRDHHDRQEQETRLISELKKALLNKSLSSNITRIFHILMILKENLYELEFYGTKYIQEPDYIDKIEFLSAKFEFSFSNAERHEFNHIRDIAHLSQKILFDTRTHAQVALNRCKSLFKETSEVLWHVIAESGKNEVLVLNLLREKQLLEKIYGTDAAEKLFSEMYQYIDIDGIIGSQKAINYVRENCGNISGLSEDVR